jgi:hypothetical protein
MKEWQNSEFLGQEDSALLEHAAAERFTLVTYDRRTIPLLLKAWAEEERKHGGVIFIDEKTTALADVGGQVRALTNLVRDAGKWDWTNRIWFLERYSQTVWLVVAPFCRRLALVARKGFEIAFQRPLNSSISAMSFKISGVMVMSPILWVWISIYTHLYPIRNRSQVLSVYSRYPMSSQWTLVERSQSAIKNGS